MQIGVKIDWNDLDAMTVSMLQLVAEETQRKMKREAKNGS